MQEQYYLRVDEQQSDWSLGARAAFGTYLEQARNVAGQTRTLFSNAFGNMEDAVLADRSRPRHSASNKFDPHASSGTDQLKAMRRAPSLKASSGPRVALQTLPAGMPSERVSVPGTARAARKHRFHWLALATGPDGKSIAHATSRRQIRQKY
ncbi:phage tail tape measure C-terminal domain-containing protein [Pseudomonas putida]|uniref:phage tail tape measure C-terminal domain-containing protein n=1 Tax=Pseudomonas putida TaxID=303 RepID=UPI00330AB07A|nr:hypothetical protein [Pseudomonas putida]